MEITREIVTGLAIAAGGALAAIVAGGVVEIARAFLDPIRRLKISHRSFAENVRHMLS